MTETQFVIWASWAEIVLVVVTCIALVFVTAPYGRHDRPGWGRSIPNALGWVIMELPAVALFIGIYVRGEHSASTAPLVLLGMWQLHYIHRTFIYPLRLRTRGKHLAVVIVVLALVFNSLNSYINARWISHQGRYANDWLVDPRFIIGALLFLVGYGINHKADRMLLQLRQPGETGYTVPRGWLYERITCPNYFGEILEWTGFALAAWSLPGLAFALYTAANIGPRAFSNHRWYQQRFPDYPPNRKALIPYVI